MKEWKDGLRIWEEDLDTILHLPCQYCGSSAPNVCSLALTDSCLVGCLWDTSTKTYYVDMNVKRNTLKILSDMVIIFFCFNVVEESIKRMTSMRGKDWNYVPWYLFSRISKCTKKYYSMLWGKLECYSLRPASHCFPQCCQYNITRFTI